jgi:low affinity Fe/Cu permease
MTDTSLFYRFSHSVAREAGKPRAFAAAVASVVVWAVTGPMFHFSETWQLVINTGTTIITFLMVFLVQNTQNRDGEAVQAKLDELILVTRASNTFIGAEQLTAEELKHLRAIVAEKAKQELEKKAAKAVQNDAGEGRASRTPSGS